jgi:hypothetical protein
MSDWVLKLLLIGFIAWVIWSLMQPRHLFEIRIEDGQPSARKGKVTRAFLNQVASVCGDCRVTRGWIAGVMSGQRVALRFSREFPPGAQQRIRNEWTLAG